MAILGDNDKFWTPERREAAGLPLGVVDDGTDIAGVSLCEEPLIRLS